MIAARRVVLFVALPCAWWTWPGPALARDGTAPAAAPRSPPTAIEQALVARFADGDVRAARAWLHAAVAADPGDATAWADLAVIAESPAARSFALSHIPEVRAAPASERAIIAADRALIRGDQARAAALLEDGVRAAPDDLDLACRAAVVLSTFGASAARRAVEHAQRLLGAPPDSPLAAVALAALGEAEATLDHAGRAEAALRALAEARPAAPHPLVLLGRQLEREHRLGDARDAFAAALRRSPGDVPALAALAGIDGALGQRAAARRGYAALADATGTPAARFDAAVRIAALFGEEDDWQDAEEQLARTLDWAAEYRAEPFAPKLWTALSIVDLVRSDPARAIADLDEADRFLDRSLVPLERRAALRAGVDRWRRAAAGAVIRAVALAWLGDLPRLPSEAHPAARSLLRLLAAPAP